MKRITASLLLAAVVFTTPACYVDTYSGYGTTGVYGVNGLSTYESAAVGGAVGAIGGYGYGRVYPRYYGGAGVYRRAYRRSYRYY
jgi:hypothetical protein